MTDMTCCTGCGRGLVPILSRTGATELNCLWCESIDARTVDMAKWADSPTGKPERTTLRSFD